MEFSRGRKMTLPSEQAAKRLKDRVTLLKALNGHGRPGDVDSLDAYHRHALELLNGGVAGSAFDLNREPLRQRERYGNHLWGQQTILARRLAEAGVPFTLVNYTLNQEHGQDWDTHVDNFNQLKNKLLPPMDLAVSTLLDDLEERGLLESTIVAMYGEFGRTPRINPAAGRDHWEKVFSVMIAGGGLKSGVVVGAEHARRRHPPRSPRSFQRRPGHYLPPTRRPDRRRISRQFRPAKSYSGQGHADSGIAVTPPMRRGRVFLCPKS